jgi:roadblock/LC7 domain-containing protein
MSARLRERSDELKGAANMTNIQAAATAGTETAEYIMGSADADNWSELLPTDTIPEEDYRTLTAKYGDVTRAMETAYKNAFNARVRAANE